MAIRTQKRLQNLNRTFVNSYRPKNNFIVPVYSIDEDGNTICTPTPECSAKRFIMDGKSCEVVNQLCGAMPDNLSQINAYDPMTSASKITDACVRRFGELATQREELVKKYGKTLEESVE